MFKLESYVTPYILAYLGKYFKNFDPSDFQMSLWGGGAVFQNLNLNLPVLDQELNLPVTFVSGHIHDLKIIVPWTKVTSEPIQVNINTIEVTLKLKSLYEDHEVPLAATKSSSSPKLEPEHPPENPPPGYMQNLISKILNNVHVNFENVIVKYVEEDIVLSLNIKKASYCTVDGDWNSAFVDLIGPDFILRKKFLFTDLTICLDKTNTAGRIETYQEPFLYRCTYEVRIFQQFKSTLSKTAYFTRMDFHVDDMDFTVTDEQIPMIMRLYSLMHSLFQINLHEVPLRDSKNSINIQANSNFSKALESEDDDDEEEVETSLLDWGSWAISWLPPISAVLGEEIEDGDSTLQNEPEDLDRSTIICHYGFYINKVSITFKALERICDQPRYGRTIKVKFMPFLKCSLQGIIGNFVLRGDEANYVCGVSQITVDPEGFCPCGIVDDRHVHECPEKIFHFMRVGNCNSNYAKLSMFAPDCSEFRPIFNYDFKYEGHVEAFSEEMMLERTPAFAAEYLQTHVSDVIRNSNDVDEPNSVQMDIDTVDLSKDKLLTRIVLAPCRVAVCSGLIHRLKLITYAVDSYCYEPYGGINKLMGRIRFKDRHPLDLSIYRNFENAYDVYQVTIIQPQIDLWASDHPEYDYETRDKHLHQKRRIKTTTPFSHIVPNWPKLRLHAKCIDARMLYPNLKYRSLVERASANSNVELSYLPQHILDSFRNSLETKIFSFECSLITGVYTSQLIVPCNLTYVEKVLSRTDLRCNNLDLISEKFISSDTIITQFTWAELILAHLIGLSLIQNIERFSEHLTTSTLLYDVPRDRSSKLKMAFLNINFRQVCTAATISSRFSLRKCGLQLEGPKIRGVLPVFNGPSPHPGNEDIHFALVLMEFPLEFKKQSHSGEVTMEGAGVTPVFIIKLSEFKLVYEKEILMWMNYHPQTVECIIPQSVRMGKDMKIPLRPLSRSTSRDGSRKSDYKPVGSSSDGRSALGTSIGGDALETDVQVVYKNPTSALTMSAIADSHGSSQGGGSTKSSLPGYQLPPRKSRGLVEDLDDLIYGWEQWMVLHLNVLKNTFIHLNIGEGQLWFPVRSSSMAEHMESPDNVVIVLPKIYSQPQSMKDDMDFKNMELPLRFDNELFGRVIFPLHISLDNMHFYTTHENFGEELCCDPLSILVTFSLTTKEAEGKIPVTTACLHTDIAAVNVNISFSQMLLLIRLAEQFVDSARILRNFSGFPMLPIIESDEITAEIHEERKMFSDTKSEASSSYATPTTHSASKIKINFDKDQQSSMNHQNSLDGSFSLPESESERILTESVNKSSELLQEDCTKNDPPEAKATLWMQMTVGVYRFTLNGANHNDKGEAVEKLVLKVEDIVSSLDFQSVFIKWTHKVSNIRLRNYERKPNPSSTLNEWTLGKTLGVIISSGNEISREIQLLSSSFNTPTGSDQSSRTSLPLISSRNHQNLGTTGASSTHQKMRGFLTMTLTRVQSTNYHKKSGVPSPTSKWNATVLKFAEKDYELYAPFDDEEKRCLSEIDIKIRSLDFVINPLVFKPYVSIIEKILEMASLEEEEVLCPDATEVCHIPHYNNNTLPLLYLETEAIRIFFKGEILDRRSSFKTNIPDFILVECSSINIGSHTENPLDRTIVRPHLFQMAEKARILGIPGSPLEDRQYQIDFHGVTVSTGFWQQLSKKSNKVKLRSSVMLHSQGENPALEWNIREIDLTSDDVKTFPLLDRLEFSIGVAPAMVYERSPGNVCQSFVIAGHALELNVTSDVKFNLNVDQLECIKQIYCQSLKLVEKLASSNQYASSIDSESDIHGKGYSIKTEKEEHFRRLSGDSSFREWDSGIDSLAHLPQVHLTSGRNRGILKNVNKKHQVDQWHKHHKDIVPVDVLLTGGMIMITMYDLKYNMLQEVEEVIPLAFTLITQPYFVLSISQFSQKIEVSIFELSIRLGSDSRQTNWIPAPDEFDEKAFESIPGERDPKTGMVPPLFNLKVINFLDRACSIMCEIRRPIKIQASQRKVESAINLANSLLNMEDIPLTAKRGKTRIVSKTDIIEQNRKNQQAIRKFFGKIATASFTCNQFLISLIEEPAEITWSCSSIACSFRVLNHYNQLREAEHITADIKIKSVSASSTLHNRSSSVITPFNIHVDVGSKWKSWLEYPMITFTITLDPVSIYIGPQSILAFLTIHNVFKDYIDEVGIVEEEIIELLEQPEPSFLAMICDSYEDDLRAGSFKFVRVPSSLDLPQVYQIAFCELHRTMTWRYPQQRVLSSILASPVPIDSDRLPSLKKKMLECTVEYWDDAMCQFLYYGSFTLSEHNSTSVGIPDKDKLHSYNSNIWRIKIETPLEEADSKHLVRAEILAACLKVDSIHDSSLVPKLKVYVEVPRISVNFVNNFCLGGRGPNKTVCQYSNNSLMQFDQPFSKLNLEMTSILMSVWLKHCTIDYNSYVKFDVLDYEFMTLTRVVDPVLLKCNLCLYEMESSNDMNSELEIIFKHVTVKFGAATLHTLLSSLTSWNQLLEAWDGSKLNLSNISTLDSVNVNKILVFNTLNSQIKIHQSGAEGSIFVRGGECVPFYWSTHKEKPTCKLGIKEKEWAYSCSFDLKTLGYVVRNLHKRPVFIHVANFSGSQRLVTVTGSLFVGNALNEDLEIAALPSNKSSEVIWKVPSRHYGSSQLMDISEIEHFRFRISIDGKSEPWSSVVTPNQLKLKASKHRSVCISLFKEQDTTLTEFCVWCSLIEEKLGEKSRYLIILSPFFRVRSFLPCETSVHITTAKQSNTVDYCLKGMGDELQIDFTGSHSVAHHLTFQSTPLGSASTPSIPLLPEGPILQMCHVERSIDDILSEIMSCNFGKCVGNKDEKLNPECSWPFISDVIPNEEWTFCEQPETELDVEFTPWVKGLPTVLLDVRPSTLVVNLCGTDLLLSQSSNDEDGGWSNHIIPHKCVFSPARISLSKGRFKLGINVNNTEVQSEKLRFSDEQHRTDIHHANINGVIPIDSFSRLDIHLVNEIACLTIETRIRKKMLVMTVRPTFSIINKTSEEIFVQSLSISSSELQTRENWNKDKLSKHCTLKPVQSVYSFEAMPLLKFFSDEQEYSAHMKSTKYLALSCGGPWWFVQLIDFKIIFDNMNSSQGVPAAAKSVTLPKLYADLKTTSNVSLVEDYELNTITIPIIVSWTSKNGQVWISLSPDPCPQIVLHNHTSVPFVYVQSIGNECEPFQETEYFEQYLVLPPRCKSHYTFSQKYSDFPQLTAKNKLPNLLLTKLPPQNVHDISNSQSAESLCESEADINETQERLLMGENQFGQTPSSTCLLPGINLNWSKELNVNGEALQYFCVGEYVDVKIIIEKLGFTYYIYLENMSNIEVAAKDVRRRIMIQSVGVPTCNLIENSPLNSARTSSSLSVMASSAASSELDFPIRSSLQVIMEPPDELECSSQTNNFNGTLVRSPTKVTSQPSWCCRCYIPKFSILVMEDLISSTERRELISFTIEDFFFDQIPEFNKTRFRSLLNRTKESWLINIRIGNFQVDSPGFPFERTCDFPVILKQEDEYEHLILPEKHGRTELQNFYNLLKTSNSCMLSCTITYGQSSVDYLCMETVSLICRAFFLNVEDRLVDFVIPSLNNVYDVGIDQFHLMSACATPKKNYSVNTIIVPEDIFNMLENFSHPNHIESFRIEPLEVCLTLRIARLLYLAVDHSRLKIPEFEATTAVTTSYNLGQSLSAHYTTGAIFQIGNPMRLIGSLELLGSPGSLAQSVGTGLKDFVVFPYQGIFQGPTGFVAGLGNGVTSLVKSVTSGTLTSVTNWAWSVSRNIDKLTLDEEEQILTEGARRVQLDGFTDGFVRGLTGFGIRLLGAVGGIAHHPIRNVIQGGATPSNVIQGVSRGVLGVVTRPIGGIVELIAMTGQGVLRGAGWTPQLKTKGETLIEEVWNNPNSLFKYQIVLKGEDETERLLLLVDAVQPNGKGGLAPVSLLLSTKNLYVIDVTEDVVISHIPVSHLTMEMDEEGVIGDYIVSPHDKCEFVNVLCWVKMNQDDKFFKV